jgi:pSer/pThr/pTyr-binding forkhead associated (FHA) protein
MEAARALEEADQGAVAGEIYERLGMLRRAARDFERAGAISQLEYVLGLLDRHEQIDQALQNALQAVDAALREGSRLLAHSLLQEHLYQQRSGFAAATPPAPGPGAAARGGLVQRLANLEAALPRGPRLGLRWQGHVTQVLLAPQLRIGRAPDVELSLPGAGLSREHVVLRVEAGAQGVAIAAVDLGSKAGSFWRGEALEPGEPQVLDEPGELGLGFGNGVHVHPLRESSESQGSTSGILGALIKAQGASDWLLFLPSGGPLWLDPGHALPARVDLRPPFVGLQVAAGVAAHLGSEPLGPGASLELMLGDRLHLTLPDGRLTLEVIA